MFSLVQVLVLGPMHDRQRIDFGQRHHPDCHQLVVDWLVERQIHAHRRVRPGNRICWNDENNFVKIMSILLESFKSNFRFHSIIYLHECGRLQIRWSAQFLWIFYFEEIVQMANQNADQWVCATAGQN